MQLKGSKTERNLMYAFGGECQARTKYSFYGSKAKSEGYQQIAAIFDDTAENEKEGKEHAWFVCYAPAENPTIAVCVMQEYTGKTGSSCAPIARELIEYYLKG